MVIFLFFGASGLLNIISAGIGDITSYGAVLAVNISKQGNGDITFKGTSAVVNIDHYGLGKITFEGLAGSITIRSIKNLNSAATFADISYITATNTLFAEKYINPNQYSYALYDNAVNIIIGDFNGDGKDDFIRQEKNGWDSDAGGTADLYISRGDGTFINSVLTDSIDMKGTYVNIIVGDFNGDGKDDFIRQEKNGMDSDDVRTADIYFSNGNSFTRYVLTDTIFMKGTYTNIIVGDFNGDGKDDFIRQEKGAWDDDDTATANLYISRGDSTFKKVAMNDYVDMKGDFTNIIVGDFNGDGKDDFIRQEKGAWDDDNSRNAELYLFNSENAFTEAKKTSTTFINSWNSQNIYSRQLVDINGDGKADIVGFGKDAVYTSISNGDGTFADPKIATTNFTTSAGWSSQSATYRELADINGDGKADIVGFAPDAVYTSLSNGDGTFAAAKKAITAFTTNAGNWHSQDIYIRHLADINGDGKADIVGFAQDAVYTSLSNGDGTFAAAKKAITGFTVNAGNWSPNDRHPRYLADINGDGKADIVGFGEYAIYTSLAKGDGTFADAQIANYSFSASQSWVSNNLYTKYVSDVNGDGKADIIGFGQHQIYIALAKGDGTFADMIATGIPSFTVSQNWSSNDLYTRLVADINGDGKSDIVGFGMEALYTSFSSFDSTFIKKTIADSNLMKGDFTNLIVGDFNGDGKDDFIRQEKGAWDDDDLNNANIYFANANGTFTKKDLADANLMKGDSSKIIVADFNGDGKDDFVVQQNNQTNTGAVLCLYLSKGDGTFVKLDISNDPLLSAQYSKLITGNFNGDGKDDFIRQIRVNLQNNPANSVYFGANGLNTALGGSVNSINNNVVASNPQNPVNSDIIVQGASGNVNITQQKDGKVEFLGAAGVVVVKHTGDKGDVIIRGAAAASEVESRSSGNITFTGAGAYTRVSHSGTGNVSFQGAGAANILNHSGTGNLTFQGAGAANILNHRGTGNITFEGAGNTNIITHIGTGDINFTGAGVGNFIYHSGTGNITFTGAGMLNIIVHKGDGTLSYNGSKLYSKLLMLAASNTYIHIGNGHQIFGMSGGFNFALHKGDGDVYGAMIAAGNVFTKIGNGDVYLATAGAGNFITHINDNNANNYGRTSVLMSGGANIVTKTGNGELWGLMLGGLNVASHIGNGDVIMAQNGGGNILTKVGNGNVSSAQYGVGNVLTHIGDGNTKSAMVAGGNIFTKVGGKSGDTTAAMMMGKANIFTHIGNGDSYALMGGTANIFTKVGGLNTDKTVALMSAKGNFFTHIGNGTTVAFMNANSNIFTKVGNGDVFAALLGTSNIATHIGAGNDFVFMSGTSNIFTKVGDGNSAALMNGSANIFTQIGNGDQIFSASGSANIVSKFGNGNQIGVASGNANIITHVNSDDQSNDYIFASGSSNIITKVGSGDQVVVLNGSANIITHVSTSGSDNDDYHFILSGSLNIITKVGDGKLVAGIVNSNTNIITHIGNGDNYIGLWGQNNVITKVGGGDVVAAMKGNFNILTTVSSGDSSVVNVMHGQNNINTNVGDGSMVSVMIGNNNINTKIGNGTDIAVMKGNYNLNFQYGDGLSVVAAHGKNNISIKIGNGDVYGLTIAKSDSSIKDMAKALWENLKQTTLGYVGSEIISDLVWGPEDQASASVSDQSQNNISNSATNSRVPVSNPSLNANNANITDLNNLNNNSNAGAVDPNNASANSSDQNKISGSSNSVNNVVNSSVDSNLTGKTNADLGQMQNKNGDLKNNSDLSKEQLENSSANLSGQLAQLDKYSLDNPNSGTTNGDAIRKEFSSNISGANSRINNLENQTAQGGSNNIGSALEESQTAVNNSDTQIKDAISDKNAIQNDANSKNNAAIVSQNNAVNQKNAAQNNANNQNNQGQSYINNATNSDQAKTMSASGRAEASGSGLNNNQNSYANQPDDATTNLRNNIDGSQSSSEQVVSDNDKTNLANGKTALENLRVDHINNNLSWSPISDQNNNNVQTSQSTVNNIESWINSKLAGQHYNLNTFVKASLEFENASAASFTKQALTDSVAMKGDLTNIIVGDFNGDGKDDFIRQEKGDLDNDDVNTANLYLSNGNGTFEKTELTDANLMKGDLTNLIVGDFNGDGKDDFIRQEKGDLDNDDINTANLYLSNGDGTFGSKSLTDYVDMKGDLTNIIVGDFNGDGKDDFIRQEKGILDDDNLRSAEIYFSNGSSEFAQPIKANNFFGQNAAAGNWTNNDQNPRMLADINGDGKADIVGFGGLGVYTALSNGDGTFGNARLANNFFGQGASGGGWASNDQYPRMLADINGDGKADIVGFGGLGVYTALSNGDGTFGSAKLANNFFGQQASAGGWSSSSQYTRQLTDVNGDGKADIIGFAPDGVYVALARGDGTFEAAEKSTSNNFVKNSTNATSENLSISADVNGDGKADIISFGADGVYTSLFVGADSFTKKTITDSNLMKGDFTNLIVGDFNGDGKDDFIRQEKGDWDNDNLNNADIYFASANGTFVKAELTDANLMKGDLTNLIVGDFNGDGKDDFIRQEKGSQDSQTTANLYLSNGDGTFTKSDLTDSQNMKGDNTNLIVGDFTGDGRDDFIRQEKADLDNDDTNTANIYISEKEQIIITIDPTTNKLIYPEHIKLSPEQLQFLKDQEFLPTDSQEVKQERRSNLEEFASKPKNLNPAKQTLTTKEGNSIFASKTFDFVFLKRANNPEGTTGKTKQMGPEDTYEILEGKKLDLNSRAEVEKAHRLAHEVSDHVLLINESEIAEGIEFKSGTWNVQECGTRQKGNNINTIAKIISETKLHLVAIQEVMGKSFFTIKDLGIESLEIPTQQTRSSPSNKEGRAKYNEIVNEIINYAKDLKQMTDAQKEAILKSLKSINDIGAFIPNVKELEIKMNNVRIEEIPAIGDENLMASIENLKNKLTRQSGELKSYFDEKIEEFIKKAEAASNSESPGMSELKEVVDQINEINRNKMSDDPIEEYTFSAILVGEDGEGKVFTYDPSEEYDFTKMKFKNLGPGFGAMESSAFIHRKDVKITELKTVDVGAKRKLLKATAEYERETISLYSFHAQYGENTNEMIEKRIKEVANVLVEYMRDEAKTVILDTDTNLPTRKDLDKAFELAKKKLLEDQTKLEGQIKSLEDEIKSEVDPNAASRKELEETKKSLESKKDYIEAQIKTKLEQHIDRELLSDNFATTLKKSPDLSKIPNPVRDRKRKLDESKQQPEDEQQPSNPAKKAAASRVTLAKSEESSNAGKIKPKKQGSQHDFKIDEYGNLVRDKDGNLVTGLCIKDSNYKVISTIDHRNEGWVVYENKTEDGSVMYRLTNVKVGYEVRVLNNPFDKDGKITLPKNIIVMSHGEPTGDTIKNSKVSTAFYAKKDTYLETNGLDIAKTEAKEDVRGAGSDLDEDYRLKKSKISHDEFHPEDSSKSTDAFTREANLGKTEPCGYVTVLNNRSVRLSEIMDSVAEKGVKHVSGAFCRINPSIPKTDKNTTSILYDDINDEAAERVHADFVKGKGGNVDRPISNKEIQTKATVKKTVDKSHKLKTNSNNPSNDHSPKLPNNSNHSNDISSTNGNLQMQIGDGEFTAGFWGENNLSLKVGSGGFKSAAFGDNNLFIHIGDAGPNPLKTTIGNYEAFEGAQLLIGERNLSFNYGDSNDFIVMFDKSIPLPPFQSPFSGPTGIVNFLKKDVVKLGFDANGNMGADYYDTQNELWNFENSKAIVGNVSGLDSATDVAYETLFDYGSENIRTKNGLLTDIENTLNKKYNKWLGGGAGEGAGEGADQGGVEANIAIGGQGADIILANGDYQFFFGDNIQSVLDTTIGSLFAVMHQDPGENGMSTTTFTYDPTKLPSQLSSRLNGNLAAILPDITLGDIFRIDYTASGAIVADEGYVASGNELSDIFATLAQFGNQVIKQYASPQGIVSSLKSALNIAEGASSAFVQTMQQITGKNVGNDTPAPSSQPESSSTVGQVESSSFGFGGLTLPSIFSIGLAPESITKIPKLIDNLTGMLDSFGGDAANMKQQMFNFFTSSGYMVGDSDLLVSLGDKNYVWGGDGNDIGAFLGLNNNFWGGKGDDVYYGMGDNNQVSGNEGNDTGILTGSSNMFFGGAGDDFALAVGRQNNVAGNSGNDQLFMFGANGLAIGGVGDDYIVAVGNFNSIQGGEGGDYIVSIGNNAEVLAGAGTDIVNIFGNKNNVDTESGNDMARIFSYDSKINTSSGNDYIVADVKSKMNQINAGSGNDSIILGGYGNQFTGGINNDIFIIDNSAIYSQVTDLNVDDKIAFQNLTFDQIWFGYEDDNLIVYTNRGFTEEQLQANPDLWSERIGYVVFDNYFAGGNNADIVIDYSSLSQGSDFESYATITYDTLYNMINYMNYYDPLDFMNGFYDDLYDADYLMLAALWQNVKQITKGNDANNILKGTTMDDIIYGNYGNDVLNGQSGDDILNGGFGADTLNGGDGFDIASYIDSTTSITIDLINSGLSNGQAQGDSFNSIEGYEGSYYNDIIRGSNNNESLYGLDGDDVMEGNAGNDVLFGDDGDDTLNGGSGKDIIIGGYGTDLITGGAGADQFVFEDYFESTTFDIDIISDFIKGEDKIDVSVLDFDSITYGKDSNDSEYGLEYRFENGNTIIEDPYSDFAIKLVGQVNLANNDFNF